MGDVPSTTLRGYQRANLLVPKAIGFATVKHASQFRHDGKTPYIAHPMRVLAILLHEFEVSDPEVLAAGVLHDTIEDTTTDFDELLEHFGTTVASMVAVLTKDKRLPHDLRESKFLAQLCEAGPAVKLVKLADVLDNYRDGTKSPKQQEKAAKVLKGFTAAGRLTDESYGGTVASALHILQEEVERTVPKASV